MFHCDLVAMLFIGHPYAYVHSSVLLLKNFGTISKFQILNGLNADCYVHATNLDDCEIQACGAI